jgi:hypothetical protein
VTIIALAEEEESIDILQLSGTTTVLPLKHQLAEYLANRVDTGRPEAHVVGEFRGLQLAELPARDTPFVGTTVRDTRLRQQTGLSVVGFWERGKLHPAFPQTTIQSGHFRSDRGLERKAAHDRRTVAASARDRSGQGRPSRRTGSEEKGLTCARGRSDRIRTGTARWPDRQRIRRGRRGPPRARTRRDTRCAISAAHDQ